MNEKPKILIVDDDKSVLTSLLILFRHHNFEPTIESNPKKIKLLLTENQFKAVILDMNFRRGYNEGKEGIFWLDTIKHIQPKLNVILFTAYGDVDLAVEAVKKGATDFILKPWNNDDLISKVKSIIKVKKVIQKSDNIECISKLVGESDAIKEVVSIIKKVSESTVSVIVTGENGVGKNLVAREIHCSFSKEGGYPHMLDFTSSFLKLELEEEIKSISSKTLVLNHIELMDSSTQKILFQLLEGRKNLKVISICNHLDLLNSFDKDFLQRLNLIHIDIQPLRERKGDIKLLANYFLKEFSTKYGRKASELSPDAINKLNKHLWIGNVKELQHCIERAIILSEDAIVDAELIKIEKNQTSTLINSSGTLNLSELEKETIIKAIEGCEGNITKASKKLGITRTALYRRMEKYDI